MSRNPRKPKRNARVKYCGTGLHSLCCARSTRSMIAWNHRRTVYCAGARSNYFVLPVFALANAGWPSRRRCGVATRRCCSPSWADLVIGKPIGLMSASALGVDRPWRQAGGVFLASTRRCLCIGRYWVYHVIVHRWPHIPDTSRLCCRKVAVFSASV